jgi:hypothetical protein
MHEFASYNELLTTGHDNNQIVRRHRMRQITTPPA